MAVTESKRRQLSESELPSSATHAEVLALITATQAAARKYRETHASMEGAANIPGFSAEEAKIIAEGSNLYHSPEFAMIRRAHRFGFHAVVHVRGQVIQYDPMLPRGYQGETYGQDIVIGRSAFISDLEAARTVGHELFRLRMEQTGWASGQHSADAHDAARAFADRAGEYIMRKFR